MSPSRCRKRSSLEDGCGRLGVAWVRKTGCRLTVASTFDSGERVQHGHITRRGSGELRSMLCEAAHHVRRPAIRSSPTSPAYAYAAATRWPSSRWRIGYVGSCTRCCGIEETLM
jgi:hypothetical protein